MIRAASLDSWTRSSGVPALPASPLEVTRILASWSFWTSWINTSAQPHSTSCGCGPLANLVDEVLPLKHLAEHGVFGIQVLGRDMGNEELASVGVGTGVGHRQG